MKNIGARPPVLAPSVMETRISCRISSKFIGPCRLWLLLLPPFAWFDPLLLELPSDGSLLLQFNKLEKLHNIDSKIKHLLEPIPPRLPVIMGPKISFAILKYGVLLFPDDIWNGPIVKSFKTPRIIDSSWSNWLRLELLLLSGNSSINPSRHRGHTKS